MADSTAPDLSRLFAPRAIAVAGASTNPDSAGHDYVRAMREFGFAGAVYPINPKASEIAGYPAYPTILDCPGDIDLVISCIPGESVPLLVEQCGQKGVPFLHLFTGRFSETGDEGAANLERDILSKSAALGVRILGPNGMGLYNPGAGVSFRPDLPRATGSVAILSQSGNNAVEIAVRGASRGLGWGKVANYGNGKDLTPAVLLRYLGDDPETTVIGAYVEGVPDGRAFFDALKYAAARKPVVIHKAGRTSAGARSAASHTAALAGAASLWSTAIRQAGAFEARNQEQLLDLLVALSLLPPLPGRRIAVVGGGGGRSVQSADACEENGFEVVPLTDAVRNRVRERAPQLAEWIGNPVDQSILAGSGLSSNGVLEMMLAGDDYDVAIANIGEDWFLGRPDAGERMRKANQRLLSLVATGRTPIAVVFGPTENLSDWQREVLDSTRDELIEAGCAVFPSVERAAWALGTIAPR